MKLTREQRDLIRHARSERAHARKWRIGVSYRTLDYDLEHIDQIVGRWGYTLQPKEKV